MAGRRKTPDAPRASPRSEGTYSPPSPRRRGSLTEYSIVPEPAVDDSPEIETTEVFLDRDSRAEPEDDEVVVPDARISGTGPILPVSTGSHTSGVFTSVEPEQKPIRGFSTGKMARFVIPREDDEPGSPSEKVVRRPVAKDTDPPGSIGKRRGTSSTPPRRIRRDSVPVEPSDTGPRRVPSDFARRHASGDIPPMRSPSTPALRIGSDPPATPASGTSSPAMRHISSPAWSPESDRASSPNIDVPPIPAAPSSQPGAISSRSGPLTREAMRSALIITEDTDAVKTISRVLRACEVETVSAANLSAAMRRLEAVAMDKPVTLVFVDGMARALDGPGHIEGLREQAKLAGARFIVFASLSSNALVELRVSRGADDWLATHSGMLHMEALIRQWIQNPDAPPLSGRPSSRASNPFDAG
jgi:CheY-like chemotaxis protein